METKIENLRSGLLVAGAGIGIFVVGMFDLFLSWQMSPIVVLFVGACFATAGTIHYNKNK